MIGTKADLALMPDDFSFCPNWKNAATIGYVGFRAVRFLIQLSNSERMCVRILAARCARALRRFSPSRRTRGRRESRMRAAPAVSCAKCTKENAHEHTGSAEAIRPSLRNGFTAYSALSPVNGLCCHRRHADRSTRLDASVGASGPHDFAVRVTRRSSRAHPRPPHPASRP